MKIAIVGLGLIGGSLAKAIKKNTDDTVYGIDISGTTVASALSEEAIDYPIETERLNICDIVIVALHPNETIDFILSNKQNFKKGGIVIDCCGVKETIVNAVEQPLADEGVRFLGCHPMAGREFSGFAYSLDNLFEKASFIMTPTDNTPISAVKEVSAFAYKIGFAKCVVSSPSEHDEIIAFTSQLAHVVSSAYIKSPTLDKKSGFSAGSFKDLTRVAKLNADMWTVLFEMNSKALTNELDSIISALTDYRDSIKAHDSERLHQLLEEGTRLKEKSNNMY
ncbi:prephenate dehydrogenase [Ruminococcus sp. YE71]|uniref:prephenate dehydrogenase n=1 Tax=unclassified Ruminococcus TaxID=2608920 RepID=UPI000887B9B3|nr:MULTISPECIES: prephenate dehydrogenase [unclassified Ruminococcus]SDA12222.1 prephenate dehydrogenase [Ruminococcus sp. YE78]SFW16575.1 prephenate dehydrogenase [Ruminococcus sp. YE71]